MHQKVNSLLYASGPDLINTIRTLLVLTEPVRIPLLEEAVAKAALRFPYFSVRLRKIGSEYVLVPNPRPFVVSPGGKAVTLGTEESHDHLFAFACDGKRLYVDTSHFITDGNGLFPFIRTLLYYYLSALHPEETFDTSHIHLAGEEIPAEESDDDPYPDHFLPMDDVLPPPSLPEDVFTLDQPRGYGRAGGWTSFVYTVRQKDMMNFISTVDGSPATHIASLVYRAISEEHPENGLPLVCGMQHQFRKALGRPFSHLCHVSIIPMVYPPRLRGRSVEQLNTIARGTLLLRADDASDIRTVNAHIRTDREIRNLSLAEKHERMRRALLEGIGRNTFEVSYTGRVPWSGLDRYLELVVPYLDMTLSGGLSVEIFSVRDLFTVNIMQRNNDRRYVDRFERDLADHGIPFEAMAPEPFTLCGFRLPEA